MHGPHRNGNLRLQQAFVPRVLIAFLCSAAFADQPSAYKPPPGYQAKERGDKEIESLNAQMRREMDQRRRICPACG